MKERSSRRSLEAWASFVVCVLLCLLRWDGKHVDQGLEFGGGTTVGPRAISDITFRVVIPILMTLDACGMS